MKDLNGIFNSLTKVSDSRTCRVSSWDQSGRNQNYWMIPAAQSITLGDLEGPGCITHIWMTSSCRRIVAPGLIEPVGNGNAAPVNEIHPAPGIVCDAYDLDYYRKALIKIKSYPILGELYYEILSKKFIHMAKYTDEDVIDTLNIERTQYYKRKRKQLICLV